MFHCDDLSRATATQTRGLGQLARDLFPYGFFLAASVDIFSPMFRARVNFLRVFRVRAVKIFGGPFFLLSLEGMKPKDDDGQYSLQSFEGVLYDVFFRKVNRARRETEQNNIKSFEQESIHRSTVRQREMFGGERMGVLC